MEPAAEATARFARNSMFALTLAVLLFWPGAAAPNRAPALVGEVPSVVVFVLDDVSAFYLPGLPLPSLDALAQKGVRFDRAYGMPVCYPARRSPERYGSIPCDPGPYLGPQVGDIPPGQMFLEAGFRTAGFGKWHLGEDPLGRPWPMAPFAHGFQHWQAGVPGNVDNCGGRNYRRWARMEDGAAFLESAYQTSEIVASFHSWWATRAGRSSATSRCKPRTSPSTVRRRNSCRPATRPRPTRARMVAPPSTGHLRDSVSFVPCLRDPSQRTRAYVHVQLDDSATSTLPDIAVVSARFKLREVGGLQSFYDLRDDPLEEHSLALDDPAHRKELALRRAWLEANRR